MRLVFPFSLEMGTDGTCVALDVLTKDLSCLSPQNRHILEACHIHSVPTYVWWTFIRCPSCPTRAFGGACVPPPLNPPCVSGCPPAEPTLSSQPYGPCLLFGGQRATGSKPPNLSRWDLGGLRPPPTRQETTCVC